MHFVEISRSSEICSKCIGPTKNPQQTLLLTNTHTDTRATEHICMCIWQRYRRQRQQHSVDNDCLMGEGDYKSRQNHSHWIKYTHTQTHVRCDFVWAYGCCLYTYVHFSLGDESRERRRKKTTHKSQLYSFRNCMYSMQSTILLCGQIQITD